MECQVSVTTVPRRQGKAIDRAHVDVGREHVTAPLNRCVTDFIGEVGRVEAFSLQATLHVSDREDDCVNVAAPDEVEEFVTRKTTGG